MKFSDLFKDKLNSALLREYAESIVREMGTLKRENFHDEKIKMIFFNPELASRICEALNKENHLSSFYVIECSTIDENRINFNEKN